MLSHVLCMVRNSPAQNALHYAVEGTKKYRGRRSRHTTNLLDILKADMKERDLNPHNTSDLELLRNAAADRARWREMAKKD